MINNFISLFTFFLLIFIHLFEDSLSFFRMSTSWGFLDYRSSGSHTIQFTVNPVFFRYCGSHLNNSSGLTQSSIMKLRSLTGNRTSISFTAWSEIATKQFGISPSAAQHIFDVFYAVSGSCIQGMPSFARHPAENQRETVPNYRHNANRSLLHQMGSVVTEHTWASTSSSRVVSIPGLTMFLSIQLFLLKYSGNTDAGIAAGTTSASDVKQMDYLKANLNDYIAAVAISYPDKVTPSDISDLEFMLRQYIGRKETLVGDCEEYFPWSRDRENKLSIALLSQFIRSRMVLPSILNPKGEEDPQNISVTDLKNSIYLLPELHNLDLSTTYLSATCDIARCTRSSIYVPCPLPNTRLENLKECTVVLGPVAGVLLIENCVQCSITALCSALVVSSCERVEIYVCCNTPPALGAKLQNVYIAPYNSFYAMMSKDCQETGINPLLNLWNVGVSSDMILPAEKYVPVCFLVSPNVSKEWASRGGSPTIANICKIPNMYQDAVKNRLENFQSISNSIRGTYKSLQEQGHQEEANQLRNRIHAMFISWINQKGQGKALSELLHQPGGS